MRKRSEITARPDRAFFWNDGMDATVEHFAKQLDDFATDATHTESQDVRAQHQHRAHLAFGQLAESRVDAVNHHISCGNFFDQFARRENARTRDRSFMNGLTSESDRRKFNEGNLLTLQLHSRSLTGNG